MNEMVKLAAWVQQARRNARQLAMLMRHPDPDAFADSMVEVWLRGRVDQWILDKDIFAADEAVIE